MKKLLLLSGFLLFRSLFSGAQIQVSKNINLPVPPDTRLKLLSALDSLMVHITNGKIAQDEIGSEAAALNISVFNDLKSIQNNDKQKNPYFYKPQVINLYPIGKSRYCIKVAFMNCDSLRAIFNFIGLVKVDKVTFSIPLNYLTRYWKTTQTGNVTYHYPDNINLSRAYKFNKKNSIIATRLGLRPEKLDFYLCDNYQEVSHLLGYEYDNESAGLTNEGYGVDAGYIFSIMHNEDFSHDLFHYYSAKVRKNARNSAAEEGIAYSWGNAYYADENGEMITQQQLISVLKKYLQQNLTASLLELFRKNPAIFPSQTKVRSLIASLICDEVEREKGIAGIRILIDCGRGDDNFFIATDKLIGLNVPNFDSRVTALLAKYK
jgi:hypothetical protein